jgi:ER-bound oxygenase mpaB/B'/Rubber oxygenase, catalytic domain
VHVAEVDSFLTTYQHYGERPLNAADRDGYVSDMAVVAEHLDVPGPPTTVAELRDQLAGYQSQLYATPVALEAARFLLTPPMPLVARAPYIVLGAAAVASLPWWARLSLGLPLGPLTSRFVARPAGDAVVGLLRWALTPTSPYVGATARA